MDADKILQGRKLRPKEDNKSWISQAFHRIL
jgi:hypothetical protein